MSPELKRKEASLQQGLRAAGRVLVAFSGGVDSSYLAYAAHRTLGDASLAVTALSPSYPESHRSMAERVATEFGIPHRFVETREMESASYRVNQSDRCYHCKSELFQVLGRLRDEIGFDAVAYGVNCDDQGDFRPGHRPRRKRACCRRCWRRGWRSGKSVRSPEQPACLRPSFPRLPVSPRASPTGPR